jgi:hypothetical protein
MVNESIHRNLVPFSVDEEAPGAKAEGPHAEAGPTTCPPDAEVTSEAAEVITPGADLTHLHLDTKFFGKFYFRSIASIKTSISKKYRQIL